MQSVERPAVTGSDMSDSAGQNVFDHLVDVDGDKRAGILLSSTSATLCIRTVSSLRTLRDYGTKATHAWFAALAACLLLATPWPGQAQPPTVDYQRDIQPLFDRYCVACHACFDAPCQLDLTHADGLARGASKQPVYDGTRLEGAQPTRLFIDARANTEWRSRGFFPVAEAAEARSLLLRVLDLKADHPLVPNKRLPDGIKLGIGRSNQCPSPEEAEQLDAADQQLGMPFALPAMKADEMARIRTWLEQGARVDLEPPKITASEQSQLRRWEQWLNGDVTERVLVARWLFEHWAIARLHFDNAASGHFFRLVRSATPPGQPVEEIATRYPNSNPQKPFYYRLRLHAGTRVAKTHITFALDDGLLQRIEQLFFAHDWRAGALPGYSKAERANPFTTFAAIPPEARYRFMLENAEYFVRTFIRGPVCRGQLATDVIRDHFWVMFQDPASDAYIVDSEFRTKADTLLALPGVEDDILEGAETWIASTEARNRYAGLRQQTLAVLQPKGAALTSIWDGGGTNQNALLTVFRHHDSATVKRGWLGQKPFTLWWLDYPLFERSYYPASVTDLAIRWFLSPIFAARACLESDDRKRSEVFGLIRRQRVLSKGIRSRLGRLQT